MKNFVFIYTNVYHTPDTSTELVEMPQTTGVCCCEFKDAKPTTGSSSHLRACITVAEISGTDVTENSQILFKPEQSNCAPQYGMAAA
jgi:hypothetical protein